MNGKTDPLIDWSWQYCAYRIQYKLTVKNMFAFCAVCMGKKVIANRV